MRFYGSSISLLQYVSSCKSQFRGSVEGRLCRCVSQTSNILRQLSTTTRPKHLLPDRPARTRFAPSPTGNLHLGSIRTALFNYLLAKRTKGQFLLRVEDTDQKRTVDGAEEQIRKDLEWAGLLWDEGPVVGGAYGPYRQSERTEIYRDHVAKLLRLKHAYRCFCSSERLDALNGSRREKGLPLGYDRECGHISLEESGDRANRGEGHVVRLRVPDKYPPWHDFVYGKTGKAGKEARKDLINDPVYVDPIMVKSDGHPTYHLANVVDDHLMKITHVIRGSEWMSSTPLHLAVYEAFGWDPPHFGHVPLLVDQKNQKLSKRNFDTDISTFRDNQGIFPDALVSFAVLLGWSHQEQSDLLPLRRLEEVFDLKFTKGNTMVSFAKLQFLQQRYARQYIAEGNEHFQSMVTQVCSALLDLCDEKHISSTAGSRSLEEVVSLILRADWKSYTTPAAFALRSSNLFKPLSVSGFYEPLSSDSSLSPLRVAAASLLLVPDQLWTAAVHRDNIAAIMPPAVRSGAGSDTTADDVKAWRKEVYHFLRWSLMDGASGPPIPDLMEIMGKDVCIHRIESAIKKTIAQEQAGQLEKPNVR
jgi:glutamyl-tRNA synthetase